MGGCYASRFFVSIQLKLTKLYIFKTRKNNVGLFKSTTKRKSLCDH